MFLPNMYQQINVLTLFIIIVNVLLKVQCNFEDCYEKYCRTLKENNIATTVLECEEITSNDLSIEMKIDKCDQSLTTIKINKENNLKFTENTNLQKFWKKFRKLIWFDVNIKTKFQPKSILGIEIHKTDTLNGIKSLFFNNNGSQIKTIETVDSIIMKTCQNYEVFNKTDFNMINEIIINKVTKMFWKTLHSLTIFKWINNKIVSIDPNWSLIMFDNGKPYREDLHSQSSLDFQRCLIQFCKKPQKILSCYTDNADNEKTVIGDITVDLEECLAQITVLKLHQRNIIISRTGLNQFISLVYLEFNGKDQSISIDDCALSNLINLRFIKINNKNYANERKIKKLFDMSEKLEYVEIENYVAARNCQQVEVYLKPNGFQSNYKITTNNECSIVLQFRNSTLSTLGILVIIIIIIFILILKKIISLII